MRARETRSKLAARDRPEDRPAPRAQDDGHVAGAVGCGALAIPAARFVVEPALGAAGAGKWIKTLALDALNEGEPKRVALVADRQRRVDAREGRRARRRVAPPQGRRTSSPGARSARTSAAPSTRPRTARASTALATTRPSTPDGQRLDRPLAARARYARDQGGGRLRPRRVPALPAGDAREGTGLSPPMSVAERRSGTGSTSARAGAVGARQWLDHPLVGGGPFGSALAASPSRPASACWRSRASSS